MTVGSKPIEELMRICKWQLGESMGAQTVASSPVVTIDEWRPELYTCADPSKAGTEVCGRLCADCANLLSQSQRRAPRIWITVVWLDKLHDIVASIVAAVIRVSM
jgi:hypothetical protein